MTSVERAVGAEATVHAKPGCRLCNGSGVMQRWDPVSWRLRTKVLALEPKLEGYEATPELCGCAVSRMLKRYGPQLEYDKGMLVWKEGFAPKQKQGKIMAEIQAKEVQDARPDGFGPDVPR